MNLGALPSKFKSLSEIQMNLWDALMGKKDWRTGADLTTRGIKDSWMGRPLSNASGPAGPDISAVTEDLWKSFGGGEAESLSNWVQSAYGFNQPENWLQPQLGLVEDMTAEHFRRMKEMTEGSKAEIAAVLEEGAAREVAINKQTNAQRISDVQSLLGTMTNNFQQISEMGGKQSGKAFAMYKAFKITETLMATYSSAIKAYESLVWVPYVGPVLGAAAAGMAVAFGMAQVNMIRNAQPPSYDQGGISTTPGMYYSGVPEAHIPLKSGAIPVNFNEGRGGGDVFIVMENPVFQDLETQQAVFANIAANITERIAPNAVVRAYDNDHAIRGRIRSRA